jgi:hypothetical protein
MVVNYHWVNSYLTLEYTALIGNGHAGTIVSSTGVTATNSPLYESLPATQWIGQVLTLTGTAIRNAAGGPAPIVHLAIWQSDPTGNIPGRFNEQTFDPGAVFGANGTAPINVTITFA